MRSIRGALFALLVAGCSSNTNDGPVFTWSDDGACGVPAGYVGIDETIAEDGGCTAATWCPNDSSPICVSPPSDAGSSEAEGTPAVEAAP